MSKKDELREGLMSTFSMLNLPASELEKAKNLPAGENRTDVIVGDKIISNTNSSSSVADSPKKKESVARSITTRPPKVERSPTVEGPRYTKFIAHTFRLDEAHFDSLNRIQTEIMRNGLPKQERITINSVLRALAELLDVVKIDVKKIGSEADLIQELFAKCGFKSPPSPR